MRRSPSPELRERVTSGSETGEGRAPRWLSPRKPPTLFDGVVQSVAG
jgi:hypothetical protein